MLKERKKPNVKKKTWPNILKSETNGRQQQWTEIRPQTRAPKWQNTTDRRSVFLASTCCRQHHPSASGLPTLSTSRYFIFTLNFSLFFSLTNMGYWIWVNGFLSISVSLSLFEEWKWNEMRHTLSLFKTLSDSLFLFELWLPDWLIAFA